MFRMLGPLLLLLTSTPAAFAQQKTEPVDAGANVYKKVLPATVWIHSDRGGGKKATGSGSLIDKGRRLVLTNYHVVGDVKKATVFFPDFGRDRKAIPERQHYLDRANRLGITGEVVEIDREGDLALVRIDRVPDDATELPLAAESPDPGQAVHSIGNPGRSGALWVYTPGKVRQVYTKKWKAKLDERTVHDFKAKVIETDSPTNPGDSGGPLVNDKGELVGVTQGGATDADSLSLFVDLSEVKRLLDRRSVQALRSITVTADDKKPKELEKASRETALKSKDDGKFFSADTMKQVQATAEKLLKEKGFDLLIETFPTPPKGDAAKVAAMSAADREKFFQAFARARVKEEKLVGLYIVINKNPGSLYVERSAEARDKIPDQTVSKIRNALIEAFREKKFDSGLGDALKQVLESQGLGEKKEEKK